MLEGIIRNFSPAEKLVFIACALLLTLSAASLIIKINKLFLVEIPARGGALTEGILGSPRFINPLLALSDADRDLSALIYSGLLKATSEGTLIPDMAENYSVSENGLTYTFRIKENARFHDGTAVTADDVLFTVQKAQDPSLKSPKRANWEGVAVEKANDREVRFILKQPYAPFLENATIGILPKHIWKDADTEQFAFSTYNIDAIGSGPYAVGKIKRNSAGIPMQYELTAFPAYALGEPYITTIIFQFYQNEKELLEAKKRGAIESISALTPSTASELRENGMYIARTPLPRVFAIFFNQNQAPVLAEKEVRQALYLATDKNALVEKILRGYGVPIDGPVPPILLKENNSAEGKNMEERIAEANALLDTIKWKRNNETGIRERKKGKETETLSVSLATSNIPELQESAAQIENMWRAIGIQTRVQIFESGDLNQNIIRPRKYDALLFGEIIGRDLDLFAFWHSSQRNDPGLNIAMYTNSKVDKLLEEARRISDTEKRTDEYQKILAEIRRDQPAIFLYSPEFIYVIPKTIRGFELNQITIPSERFLSVHNWYIRTKHVWSMFQKFAERQSA